MSEARKVIGSGIIIFFIGLFFGVLSVIFKPNSALTIMYVLFLLIGFLLVILGIIMEHVDKK